MADVLASKYRYVRKTDNADQPYERVVLEPGDKASNLPKEVKEDLKKRKLVVDEKELDSNNQRIPGTVVVTAAESEPETETKSSDTKK